MTRIVLHIGPEAQTAARFARIISANRETLAARGVLVPTSPGRRAHTRLFMAMCDPDHVDPLRHARGVAHPQAQARLRDEVLSGLAAEAERTKPDVILLVSAELGSRLTRKSEIRRLRDALQPLGQVTIVAHLDEQARAYVRHLAEATLEGRTRPIRDDLAVADGPSWWDRALSARLPDDPATGRFGDIDGPPCWLDYLRLVQEWEEVFGPDSVHPLPGGPDRLAGRGAAREIGRIVGKADLPELPGPPQEEAPSAETIERRLAYARLLERLLRRRGMSLPRQARRHLLRQISAAGPALGAGSFHALSDRFAGENAQLARRWPDLAAALTPDPPLAAYRPAPFTRGFRASHHLLADLGAITGAARQKRQDDLSGPAAGTGATALPAEVAKALDRLVRSPLRPRDLTDGSGGDTQAEPFPPAPPRTIPEGSSGRVIVACMKNEAPYIVEWVAYHRAIGFDNFIVYTNDCDDGTDAILDRLEELGILVHRRNDDWRGNSPQQHALKRAKKEALVRDAEWVAHIDVDEFVNVRCGNGTLDDLFAAVPGATNIAMTWRLFGHSGVREISERFVIEQFDACAPAFCPKPHTAWGFKTLFRNIGAYRRIACHRPNGLDPERADQVRWVNGSGKDVTGAYLKNGWRSNVKTIGYDLVQLNHYAVRSAEAFLVKRQRGRALHVDRSVGYNYWVRMDWTGARDTSIRRNLSRLRAEVERLMADEKLARLHRAGLQEHRERARELKKTEEFRKLWEAMLAMRLTPEERAAYALTLDMGS